jgi:hypothetical protein
MEDYLFAVPLAPGKTDTWKSYMKELNGTRKDEYNKSRNRIGLHAEQVFLQQTPHGDMCVVKWSTENPQRAFESLANSKEPFDQWFRDKILIECHNMDFTQTRPLNKQVVNHREALAHEFAGAQKVR